MNDKINFVDNGITMVDIKKLIELISKNNVCAFSAALGSGKSTTVPEALIKLTKAKIFCTQNTILACKSLYNRMTKIKDLKIGYAAEGEINYDSSTQLVYCTSGHLFKVLCSYLKNGKVLNTNIDFCTILMIDEAHTGDINNDLIILVWSWLCRKYKTSIVLPRLVITSATLSLGNIPLSLTPDMIIKFESKRHSVEIEHHDKNYTPFDRNLYHDLGKLIKSRILDLSRKKGLKWLAFCPGKAELEMVASELTDIKNCNIIKLYSGVEQVERIFNRPKDGEIVVIISTNVAETSITISDLDAVFDSGTEKINYMSDVGGTELRTSEASKCSIDQRTGRVGRTKPGKVYRMFTVKNYKERKEFRENELLRLPLESVFLDLIKGGINPEDILAKKIDLEKIQKTRKELVNSNLLIENTLTPIGISVSIFPMSINCGRCLWFWLNNKKNSPFPGIITVALIEKGSNSYYTKEKSWIENTALKGYLKMFIDFLKRFKSIEPNSEELKIWCLNNFINHKQFKDTLTLIKRLIIIIHNSNIDVEMGIFYPENVLNIFEKFIFPKVYSGENTFIKDNDMYINEKNITYFIKDYHTTDKTLELNKIVSFAKIRVYKTNKTHMNFITFYHPIS